MTALDRLLPARARRSLRGLLPLLVAAAAAVTCDVPTGPARHLVSFAIQPMLGISLGAFGGLSVDSARLVVVRPPESVIATSTLPFSPDADQLTASVSVAVADTATYWVTVELLSGSTLLFTGVDTVLVSRALTSPSQVALTYVGPGTQIAAIQITPRDTGIAFGSSLQFHLAAADSNESPDTAFYAAWSTSGAANAINADGLFRAGRVAGTVWVYAHTPTGVRDSTQVTVSAGQAGVPASLVKVAGDFGTAPPGTTVVVPPEVLVLDGLGAPVSGAAVTFAVASGGGSVTGGATRTNATGLATVGSWTLGSTPGTNTLTASVAGLTPVTFTATGTSGAAIQLTVPGNLVALGGQGSLALVRLTPPAPVGGVTVTVTSDSTKYVTVGSPGTIAFAAGDTLGSITLTGQGIGLSILHATATGYAAGTAIVAVVPNFVLLEAPFSLFQGQSDTLSILLLPAAPTGGFAVTLTSSDTTILKIVTDTVTFAANQTNATATVQAVAIGQAAVTAFAAGYAPGATVVTVIPLGVRGAHSGASTVGVGPSAPQAPAAPPRPRQ